MACGGIEIRTRCAIDLLDVCAAKILIEILNKYWFYIIILTESIITKLALNFPTSWTLHYTAVMRWSNFYNSLYQQLDIINIQFDVIYLIICDGSENLRKMYQINMDSMGLSQMQRWCVPDACHCYGQWQWHRITATQPHSHQIYSCDSRILKSKKQIKLIK